MYRISTNLPNNDMQFHTRYREVAMNAVQNKIASQTRILNLRDDPAAAAHSTRMQSYLKRLSQYSDNIQGAVDRYNLADTQMQHGVDILQSIRELAVQGANGTYSKDDLQAMGRQVDELLKEYINTANTTDGEGRSLFAGDRTRTTPFRVIEGNVPGVGGKLVTDVQYIGDIGVHNTQIADGKYIETNFPGNSVFWAENQQIYSQSDAGTYVVQQDSSISVDGKAVELREGDNVYQVMAKINNSGAAVKASLDPVTNSLMLQTTTPHQLWLSDENGSVLQDLGVLQNGDARPPQNISRDARVFGGSAFDAIIRLRDNLYQGDHLDIGGDGLRSLDSALNNMLGNLGSVGAKSNRMQLALQRNAKETQDITGNNSRLVDVDLTKAAMDLNVLSQVHQAALSVAADVIQPTLLDFLR